MTVTLDEVLNPHGPPEEVTPGALRIALQCAQKAGLDPRQYYEVTKRAVDQKRQALGFRPLPDYDEVAPDS